MPDGPMPQGAPAPGAPPPGGGAPQGQQGQGGGVAQAIVQLDQMMLHLTQAISQNPQIGQDVKQAWQEAQSALRKAEQALVQAAGGDGGNEPDGDEGQGATTPEQGGKAGAVPMSHQSMRQ